LKNPKFFTPKSADVRICLPLVWKTSALDKPLPPVCRRLLWTAP